MTFSRYTHGSGWQDHALFQKSYLCVDIHNFKNYNDFHGLSAGDKTLVKVAQTLRAVYPQHTLYRVGGEEFVIDLLEEAVLKVNSPTDILLKFSVVQVMARKNQPKQWFVNRAIMFNIEEGFIKATRQGTKLTRDYTGI